jgi:Reverse transcriptase (RNA-dependent DNA polymerase)
MPLGFHASPSHFQRTITTVLGNLIGWSVRVYLDDIIIYTHKEAEHTAFIAEVIKRLNDFGLKGQKKNGNISKRKSNSSDT